MRIQKRYSTRFVRVVTSDDPHGLPVRTFTVYADNRLDAGEDPKTWWYVGAERQ